MNPEISQQPSGVQLILSSHTQKYTTAQPHECRNTDTQKHKHTKEHKHTNTINSCIHFSIARARASHRESALHTGARSHPQAWPTPLRRRGFWIGWTSPAVDGISSHHLEETMVETMGLLAFTRVIPGFLRWCEMDFVHPHYGCQGPDSLNVNMVPKRSSFLAPNTPYLLVAFIAGP